MIKIRKSLEEIEISEATLAEDDARVFLGFLENNAEGYIAYSKKNYVHVYHLALAFINYHALLDFKPAPYYTSIPLHVFRIENWNGVKVEGLIYSNGTVAVYHTDPKSYRLWISQETVKLFDYPRPKPIPA